jgi:hypothetical protein
VTTCGVIRLRSARPTLASIVAKASPGIRFNEHIEGDGPTVFAHACKMGLEGVRNIHSAQGVFSNGSPPRPLARVPETPPDLPLECHTVGRGSRLQDEPPHLQILCSVARASDASDRGGALATFSQILEPSGFLDLIYLWHT